MSPSLRTLDRTLINCALLIAASIFVCLAIGTAQAQSTQSNTSFTSAVSIAKQIEDNELVRINTSKDYVQPETFMDAISQVVETLSSGNEESFKQALDTLRLKAKESKSQYTNSFVKLFEEYASYHNFSAPSDNFSNTKEFLESISENEHWFVRLHAKRLLSIKYTFVKQKAIALQIAEETLSIIPNKITPETTNARITVTELIVYLQNLQRNKDLALLNTQRLIDLKLEAGYTIDGIELLNNLMYVYSAWRDNDVRLELAQTLVRLENKYGSSTPGLSNLHVASIYVDIGEYEKAIIPAKEAARDAGLQNIKHMANLILVSAYAGLGDIETANQILESVPERLQESARGQYSQTLIALKDGRVDEALSLMNNRFDKGIQRLLTETSNNTNEILASLENSSERQAEREAGLRKEAAFIQSRLDQQKKITNLLILLTCLTLLTGLGALLFAKKQHKLSKLLAIKSQEAESADRMKTEFLGMVSHELRTPLNGIIGVADILAELGETQEVRDRGKIILSSGNALFSLIESIIDMSRVDAGKLELFLQPASMEDVLKTSVKKWEDAAKEKGLVFTYHIPETCAAETQIDPLRVEQCVDTLLSNAIKFTDKGRIHLHVTTQDDKINQNRTFEIIVADTGQGMSETVQGRLFTPFLQADSSMTRKHGGSGLRLAIARGLVRMAEGDITVVSREGRGSEFKLVFPARICSSNTQTKSDAAPKLAEAPHQTFTKPVKTVPLPDAAPSENAELAIEDILEGKTTADLHSFATRNPALQEDDMSSGSHKSMNLTLNEIPSAEEKTLKTLTALPKDDLQLRDCRVLIVEDTPSNQDVVEFLLRQSGVQCVSVDNTQQALNSLNTSYFDVIIMDVHMKGDAGLEAARHIRQSGETWSDTPIIALSADNTAESNAACMAEGIDIFLSKPVLSKDLIKSLRFLQAQKQSNVTDKIEVNRHLAW